MSINNLIGGGQDLLLLRRRMMMSSKESKRDDYISDGLVFWLDGINKGDSSNWKDLVGGIVFTNNGAIRRYDGFEINESSFLSNSTDAIDTSKNMATVEACYESQNISNIVYMPANSSDQIGVFTRRAADGTFVQNTGSYSGNIWKASSFGIKNTISIANTHSVVNYFAAELQSIKDVIGSANGTTYIGRRSGSYLPNRFNGIVHSIRIYNRQLTVEEMLHNQQVDNDRFNLGLTI